MIISDYGSRKPIIRLFCRSTIFYVWCLAFGIRFLDLWFVYTRTHLLGTANKHFNYPHLTQKNDSTACTSPSWSLAANWSRPFSRSLSRSPSQSGSACNELEPCSVAPKRFAVRFCNYQQFTHTNSISSTVRRRDEFRFQTQSDVTSVFTVTETPQISSPTLNDSDIVNNNYCENKPNTTTSFSHNIGARSVPLINKIVRPPWLFAGSSHKGSMPSRNNE